MRMCRTAVASTFVRTTRSMLRDAKSERGLLKIDALAAPVRKIGQHVGVPIPQMDTLLGLVRLHAQTRGLY